MASRPRRRGGDRAEPALIEADRRRLSVGLLFCLLLRAQGLHQGQTRRGPFQVRGLPKFPPGGARTPIPGVPPRSTLGLQHQRALRGLGVTLYSRSGKECTARTQSQLTWGPHSPAHFSLPWMSQHSVPHVRETEAGEGKALLRPRGGARTECSRSQGLLLNGGQPMGGGRARLRA